MRGQCRISNTSQRRVLDKEKTEGTNYQRNDTTHFPKLGTIKMQSKLIIYVEESFHRIEQKRKKCISRNRKSEKIRGSIQKKVKAQRICLGHDARRKL